MMNGLSPVFDQIVTNSTNSYLNSNSETIDSFGQQLAFDAFADKALVEEHRLDSSDTNHFDSPFNADNCLNNYFCEQELTQNWNQLNSNQLNETLINSNDLNQCFNSFDTNFDTNIDSITDCNTNCIKQNNRKANTKSCSTNPKKLSRKESNSSAKPPKPVSAYALFFRDAQSLIKSSNPSASFGEISKVVASNWEALDKPNKNIYKQRADQQKKNYLKTLASSRAQQIAGLMAESSAKLCLTSGTDSVLSDNRFTNETNRQNDNQNNFESTQHQMSDNKGSHSMQNNSNDNQNLSDNSGQQVSNFVSTADQSGSAVPKQHCIRSGCGNDSVDSPEWDSEYCSSECCVKHCSDVFQEWVQKQEHFPQPN